MFNKRRHYSLPDVTWSEDLAKQTIEAIAEGVITQAESGEKWPKHKLDDGGQIKSDFYLGRGGSLWAIDYLQRSGVVENQFDVDLYLADLLAANQKYAPRLAHSENSSYLFGELPLLLMQYRQTATPEKAAEIAKSIQRNDTQPVRELMWGMAGSMLAALFMNRWTNDALWATLYRKQADLMLADWQCVDGIGYLWNVEVYSKQEYFLGPVHGFAGNAMALIAGFDLLSDEQESDITSRVMETTVNTALTDERFANWQPVLALDNPKKRSPLVQYCHGAPGMVSSLATLPVGENQEFDEVLLKGGELIWHAGLLEKGPSLCHGTSGNGYAFLKLFERTGDELWLHRARQFAMHSIGQYEELKAHYNQIRYPLWTGDPGLAIYLWDCVQAQAKFPTFDVF